MVSGFWGLGGFFSFGFWVFLAASQLLFAYKPGKNRHQANLFSLGLRDRGPFVRLQSQQLHQYGIGPL